MSEHSVPMSEISEALKIAVEQSGQTKTSVAEEIGVSLRGLNYYLSGEREPSFEVMEKLFRCLGLRFELKPALYDGSHKYDGTIDYSGKPVSKVTPKPTTSPRDDRMDRLEDMLSEVSAQLALIANRPGAPAGPYSPVPLYDVRAAAGGGAAVEFEEIETTLSFRRDWLLANGLTPSQCGLIRVIGDSMSPTLEEDDVTLIDFTARDLRPRHIYAIRDDGDLLVKRVVSDLGEPVELGSDNPAYPPFALDNGAAVVGRVVWSARTYRKTPSAFSIVR